MSYLKRLNRPGRMALKQKLLILLVAFLLPWQYTFAQTGNVRQTVRTTGDPREQKWTRRVTGVVTDINKEPLAGATVKLKNYPVGTTTDIDGKFAVLCPESPTALVVSYIGYESVTRTVAVGATQINFVLQEGNLLDEVVVTGYSTMSRERSTGAVSSLTSTEIDKQVLFDLGSSIEGKVTGLNTYRGDISIRGISSLSSSRNPLVVVDGIPVEGSANSSGNILDVVNPQDVESITVLKDAASASIYGSRAANGIIVITTKSGKRGKTVVDFSLSYSIKAKPRISDYKYASTSDIIDYEREYLENQSDYIKDPLAFFLKKDKSLTPFSSLFQTYYDQLRGLITEEEKEARIAEMKKNDYRKEYEDLMWRPTFQQQYNLSVRKGTDKMDMSLSVRYMTKQKSAKFDTEDNISVNLKNRLQLYSWLSVTAGAYAEIYKSNTANVTYDAPTSIMPYERIMNADGTRNQYVNLNKTLYETVQATEGLYHLGYNILDESKQAYIKDNNNMVRFFTDLDFKPFKGLTYNLKFLYQLNNNKESHVFERDSYYSRYLINKFATVNSDGTIKYNIPEGGRLNERYARNYSYTLRNQVNYNTDIIKNLSLNVFAGTEFREYNTTRGEVDIYGYDEDRRSAGYSVDWYTLGTIGVKGPLTTAYTYNRLYPRQMTSYGLDRDFSMYANGSLAYEGKYILAGSWRVDQGNLFGVDPKYKFRPLWSVSGAWNASQESFLKDVSWLDNLKLRSSVGINGNIVRTSSPYMLASISVSGDVEGASTNIALPPNPELRWEKTEIVNVGLDFAVFKKLSGSLDYYNKYTTDLVTNANLDPSTGFTSGIFNNGEMLNRGFELSLHYDWLKRKDWSVQTSFVFSYNKNTIEKINRKATTAKDQILNPHALFKVGDPYNSLYAYRYAGLTSEGDPSVYDKEGNVVENSGMMTDPEAVVYMGPLNPPITGSVGQSLRYKNFTFDALFVFYAGHKLRADVFDLAQPLSATHETLSDRWTENNRDTEIPRVVYSGGGDRSFYWKYADKHVKSASTIRLRNIILGYELKNKVLEKAKIQRIGLKLQVSNLWYWAACGDDIDPEAYDANKGIRYAKDKPTCLFGVDVTF